MKKLTLVLLSLVLLLTFASCKEEEKTKTSNDETEKVVSKDDGDIFAERAAVDTLK